MLLSKENILKLADLGTYVGTLAYMSLELERCRDANKEEGITYSFGTDVWLESFS
jgi:hypothetical protein